MASIVFNYSNTTNPNEIELAKGDYLFELWGAEGGTWDSEKYSGRGAYTSGRIRILKRTTLFVYVGEKGHTITGKEGIANATFNGGGFGILTPTAGILTHYGSSGGGATDVRTIRGSTWDEESSLKSRIMVAAGGGGSNQENVNHLTCKGGYGGEERGEDGEATGDGLNIIKSVGGFQDSTGSTGGIGRLCNGSKGSLGKGGNGGNCYSTSGGGGGYYGGGGSGVSGRNHQCGAGGSSYISGLHKTDIKDLTFFKAMMKGGNKPIREPNGEMKTGHIGNGYARITRIMICTNKRSYNSLITANFLTILIPK